MKHSPKSVSIWALFVGAWVAFDLGTKHWISSSFHLGEVKRVIPGFFNLTLVHNTGAAFGMGARWSQTFFIGVSIVATGVVVYLLLKAKGEEVFTRWGLLLILSGAIGNLVDRLRFGYVVDFLQVYYQRFYWPSFNVADAAITIGAVLFGLELLMSPRKKAE